MAPRNQARLGTAFTVSIDGHPKHGFTTGVDGLLLVGDGGGGFDHRAEDDLVPVGDTAQNTAGIVGRPDKPFIPVMNLIMYRCAVLAGDADPVCDFYCFD